MLSETSRLTSFAAAAYVLRIEFGRRYSIVHQPIWYSSGCGEDQR